MVENDSNSLNRVYPVLSLGSQGKDVKTWREFLRHKVALPIARHLSVREQQFDDLTDALTRVFQDQAGLSVDGVVGPETWKAAAKAGDDKKLEDFRIKIEGFKQKWEPPKDYPKQPDTIRRMSEAEADERYGKLMEDGGAAGAKETVVISEAYRQQIVEVPVPQLRPIPGAPDSGVVYFHKDARDRLVALFQDWERQGLMPKVLSFRSAFDPRRQRPNLALPEPTDPAKLPISMHARGLAFDINTEWNLVGQKPAEPSQRGCVYDLVTLAYQNGFCWGGFFEDRLDGSHFEIGIEVPKAADTASGLGAGQEATEVTASPAVHRERPAHRASARSAMRKAQK